MNYIYIILFWLGFSVVLAISLIPDVSLNGQLIDLGIGIRTDYVLHFLGYVLVGSFGVKSYGFSIKIIVLLLLFALASELIQYFIDGRLVQRMDLLLNVIGILSGVLFAKILNVNRRSS